MSRRNAERVFGADLVAKAFADPAPAPVSTEAFKAFLRLATAHERADLPTFRLATSAFLATLEPSTALAIVRTLAGGVAGSLADVERAEQQSRMH